MECIERNLITRVWTFYHSYYNLIKRVLTIKYVKLTQSSAWEQKRGCLPFTWPGKPVNVVPESHFPFVPRPETGIKDDFDEMEHEFSFKIIFFLEKQDFLFICSVALRNFQLERPKKSRSIYFPTGISGNCLSYLTFDG